MWHKSHITIIVFVLLGLIALALFFIFSYPLAVLKWTDRSVRDTLSNPYIDQNYYGWKEYSFEENAGILIPENWTVRKDEDQFEFIENGAVVAKIIRVRKAGKTEADEDRFRKETAAAQIRFFPFEVKSRQVENLTITNLGNGASYYAVTGRDSAGEEETHYVLLLKYGEAKYVYYLDFGELEGLDDPYYEYLIAIAYSYNLR